MVKKIKEPKMDLQEAFRYVDWKGDERVVIDLTDFLELWQSYRIEKVDNRIILIPF